MSLVNADILNVLRSYQDPALQTDYVTAQAIKTVEIQGQKVKLQLQLGYPIAGVREQIQVELTKLLRDQLAVEADIEINWQAAAHQVQAGLTGIKGVKNIIAVASGKGGVGKSTTSVNLALALQAEGARVGILDADIYGPNQPHLLGVAEHPNVKGETGLKPVVCYGLQTISIGYLIDASTPMIWRGPMVSQALQQLLNETEWEELDYLLIDLPPGTGDIQLTLAQKIPVTGAIIVTTPQQLSLLDARKGLEMFRKVKIPILGIVENMSLHVCSHCGHEEAIFGRAGAVELATATESEVLGHLPLDMQIRLDADAGKPTVVAAPNGRIAQIYRQIARRVAAKLSLQTKNYAVKFPKIVVE